VRKIKGCDAGTMYAMKVLKKATLKGDLMQHLVFCCSFDSDVFLPYLRVILLVINHSV